jgi:hypothetical protein
VCCLLFQKGAVVWEEGRACSDHVSGGPINFARTNARVCCESDKIYWQVADHPATAVRVCLQGRLRLKEVVVIVVILESQTRLWAMQGMELTSRNTAVSWHQLCHSLIAHVHFMSATRLLSRMCGNVCESCLSETFDFDKFPPS